VVLVVVVQLAVAAAVEAAAVAPAAAPVYLAGPRRKPRRTQPVLGSPRKGRERGDRGARTKFLRLSSIRLGVAGLRVRGEGPGAPSSRAPGYVACTLQT
jgi:hypothetical protein